MLQQDRKARFRQQPLVKATYPFVAASHRAGPLITGPQMIGKKSLYTPQFNP
jgi:hypothetical protein